MTLDDKLARAKQIIDSIARHDDQHVLGRVAVLEQVKAHADSAIAAATERAEALAVAEGSAPVEG